MKEKLNPFQLMQLADIKSSVAKVFRDHKHVYIMEQDSDDLYMSEVPYDLWNNFFDDKMGLTLKAGDDFQAKIVSNQGRGSFFMKFRSARISVVEESDIRPVQTDKGAGIILKQGSKMILLAGRQEPINSDLKTELNSYVKPTMKWTREGAPAFR
ncbi:hypothetical protein ACYPKM_04685 [Pseudomonas aeruginosa]